MTVSEKLHRNIKIIDSILGIIKSVSSAPKLDISSMKKKDVEELTEKLDGAEKMLAEGSVSDIDSKKEISELTRRIKSGEVENPEEELAKLQKRLEAGLEGSPEYRASDEAKDLFGAISGRSDVNFPAIKATSLLLGVDSRYLETAYMTVSGPSLFIKKVLSTAMPERYDGVTSRIYSLVLDSVPEEKKEAYMRNFLSRVGGADNLSKDLFQMGAERGFEQKYVLDSQEVVVNRENANRARSNVLSSLVYALNDTIQEDTSSGSYSDRISELDIYSDNTGYLFGENKELPSTIRFAWPTTGRMSSGYGMRKHPIHKDYRKHYGIDIAAPIGTRIYPSAPGIVSSISENSVSGKTVSIEHGGGYKTRYLHCNAIYVSKGDEVGYLDPIAEVGATGAVTGPHLHFELYKDGRTIDPLGYL